MKSFFERDEKTKSSKPFSAIWLSHLLIEIYLLMHPALVPIFRSEFGLSILQAGLLVTVPNLCRLAVGIPTGILADKHGPRPFIILSLIISGLSALLLGQSTNVSILILSLSLIMISVTLYHPPGLSVVSRLYQEPASRSRAMGLHGASGCIMQAMGAISLGLLLSQIGWRNCYLFLAFPILGWAFILSRIQIPQIDPSAEDPVAQANSQEERPKKKTWNGKTIFNVGFLLLISSIGLDSLANGGVSAFMTTFLTSSENLPLYLASLIFGLGPLIGILGSIGAGWFSSKLGDLTALRLFYAGQAIFLCGVIAFRYVPLIAFSFLMYKLFSASIWIPGPSLVANFVDKSHCGTAYSLFYFSEDSVGAVSPLVAATLIGFFGILSPFILAIVLLATSAVLILLITYTRNRNAQPACT
jgi:FSR family fosmidomycin resistance protein-like MFS transporter